MLTATLAACGGGGGAAAVTAAASPSTAASGTESAQTAALPVATTASSAAAEALPVIPPAPAPDAAASTPAASPPPPPPPPPPAPPPPPPPPPAPPPPPPPPPALPATQPTAGDWFVYSSRQRSTLPANPVETASQTTRYFADVSSAGIATRVETSSLLLQKAVRTFDAAGALTGWTSGDRGCSYKDALLYFPPLASKLGDNYTASATESCTQPASVKDITVTGRNEATESRTLTIGSFDTMKQSQTVVSTAAGSVTTTTETCWVDLVTGRAVECTSTWRTVPTGQTAATAAGTRTDRLEAYSVSGKAAVGAAVRRFAGYWQLTFTGGSLGGCDNFQVDTSGRVTASCRLRSSAGVYSTPFSLSGSVAADGQLSVTAKDGSTLAGAFSSPIAGSGTWRSVDSGGNSRSGSWTAVHQ